MFIATLLVLKRNVIVALFIAIIAKNCLVILTMPMSSVYYLYPLVLVGGMLIIVTALQFWANFEGLYLKFKRMIDVA